MEEDWTSFPRFHQNYAFTTCIREFLRRMSQKTFGTTIPKRIPKRGLAHTYKCGRERAHRRWTVRRKARRVRMGRNSGLKNGRTSRPQASLGGSPEIEMLEYFLSRIAAISLAARWRPGTVWNTWSATHVHHDWPPPICDSDVSGGQVGWAEAAYVQPRTATISRNLDGGTRFQLGPSYLGIRTHAA